MIDLGFLSRNEKFLLIEAMPSEVRGRFLVLDQEKNIRIDHAWTAPDMDGLRQKIGKIGSKVHVVVSADATLAHTSLIPVVLSRESGRDPLKAIELENLLSQAVGKVFNRCREEASAALGVQDLDAVLANSRVVGFRVDGHCVLNPLGFQSKKVEAVLELVLTTRTLLDGVKEFLGTRRSFFFTQRERAEFVAIEKLRSLPFAILSFKGESSYFFRMDRGPSAVLERKKLSWTPSRFAEAISARFGMSESAAKEIFHMYIHEHMSPAAMRKIEIVAKGVVKELASELPALKAKLPLFIQSDAELPFKYPSNFAKAVLEPLPYDAVLAKFGLCLGHPHDELPFETLAPVLEFYYDKSDSTINHWLRRHLNWLGSPSYLTNR